MIISPSISLLSKSRYMFTETIGVNIDNLVISSQEENSKKRGRRRRSIFAADRETKITRLQNKHFPRWAKLLVFATSLIYCLQMIITATIQISNSGEVDEKCKRMLSFDQDVLKRVWKKVV